MQITCKYLFLAFALTTCLFAGSNDRVKIYPLFFIPSDATVDAKIIESSRAHFQAHLLLSQKRFKALLQTDTFECETTLAEIYRSRHPSAYYFTNPTNKPDRAHLVVKELFTWKNEDRLSSKRVYVTLFARPVTKPFGSDPFPPVGGARPFNGPPGTGGGYVEMEWSALSNDSPYSFQSTLMHELGHAFGLVHPDSFGYSQTNNLSIMSYNPSHAVAGATTNLRPVILNPEDFFLLSQNRLVFPHFHFDPKLHNPQGRKLERLAHLYAMDETIGPFPRVAGRGYELFFDGNRVNGPETIFWTRDEARDNYLWNLKNNKSIKVEAAYDGIKLLP